MEGGQAAMACPDGDCVVREVEGLRGLLRALPSAVGGRFRQMVAYTCVDASPEHVALGSQQGYVWLLNVCTGELVLEISDVKVPVTEVKLNEAMGCVAFGSAEGTLRVEAFRKGQFKKYTAQEKDKQAVTALAWSCRDTLFCGYVSGKLLMVTFRSSGGAEAKRLPECGTTVVQLAPSPPSLLLVSTLTKTLVMELQDRVQVSQVGTKDRRQGVFGACCVEQGVLCVARPGLRVWTVDTSGKVLQTLKFRECLSAAPLPPIHPLHWTPVPTSFSDSWQFSTLHWWAGPLLVTYHHSTLWLLDVTGVAVCGALSLRHRITGLAIAGPHLYLLCSGEQVSLARLTLDPCLFKKLSQEDEREEEKGAPPVIKLLPEAAASSRVRYTPSPSPAPERTSFVELVTGPGEPSIVEQFVVEPSAVEQFVVEPSAVEPSAVEKPSTGGPSIDAVEPSVAEPSIGEPSIGEPSMEKPPIGGDPAVLKPPVAEPPTVEPSIEQPSTGELSAAEPSTNTGELSLEQPSTTEPSTSAGELMSESSRSDSTQNLSVAGEEESPQSKSPAPKPFEVEKLLKHLSSGAEGEARVVSDIKEKLKPALSKLSGMLLRDAGPSPTTAPAPAVSPASIEPSEQERRMRMYQASMEGGVVERQAHSKRRKRRTRKTPGSSKPVSAVSSLERLDELDSAAAPCPEDNSSLSTCSLPAHMLSPPSLPTPTPPPSVPEDTPSVPEGTPPTEGTPPPSLTTPTPPISLISLPEGTPPTSTITTPPSPLPSQPTTDQPSEASAAVSSSLEECDSALLLIEEQLPNLDINEPIPADHPLYKEEVPSDIVSSSECPGEPRPPATASVASTGPSSYISTESDVQFSLDTHSTEAADPFLKRGSPPHLESTVVDPDYYKLIAPMVKNTQQNSLYSSFNKPPSNSEGEDEEEGEEGELDTSAAGEIMAEVADIWVPLIHPSRHQLSSVCMSEELIWVVDTKGTVYCTTAKNKGRNWETVQRSMQMVATSSSGDLVWGVGQNNAKVRVNVSSINPTGESWKNLTRNTPLYKQIRFIAVDEKAVWALKVDGLVVLRKDVSKLNPEGTVWQEIPSPPFCYIACCNSVVWALNNKGKVFVRDGITAGNPGGREWVEVKAPRLIAVAISNRGVVWGVDTAGQIGLRCGATASKPSGKGTWWEVAVSKLAQPSLLSVAQQLPSQFNALWQVVSGDGTQRFRSLPASTFPSSGPCKLTGVTCCSVGVCVMETGSNLQACWRSVTGYHYTSACKDGVFQLSTWSKVAAGNISLWLVREDGELYCLTPAGRLAHVDCASSIDLITASSTALWVVCGDQVWSRQGISTTVPDGISWDIIELGMTLQQSADVCLRHVACGRRAVWAIDTAGVPHFRFGVHSREPGTGMAPAWVAVDAPGPLVNIAVSDDDWLVWACDDQSNVYARTGVTEDFPVGSKWEHILPEQVKEVCVACRKVYALTPSGDVLCRIGVKEKYPQGDYWRRIPGCYEHMSTSSQGRGGGLWVVDRRGEVWRQESHRIEVAQAEPLSPVERGFELSTVVASGWEVL